MALESHPHLVTERLMLVQVELQDAPRIRQLAGKSAVSRMLTTVPYPYYLHQAEYWIRASYVNHVMRGDLTFAICFREDAFRLPIGFVGLEIYGDGRYGELRYWLGEEYWGKGFTTEAARVVLEHGFVHMQLHKITAKCFGRNKASAGVLIKIGMSEEGLLEQQRYKDGRFEDLRMFGLLRSDFDRARARGKI